MPRIADALSPRQYEGTPVSEMATAAPPTYAQQAARIPGRVMDALRALGAGQTYGTAEPTNSISDLARARLGRGSVFGVPEDVQQRNVARATDIAMMAAPIVYHGTPHRFAPTAKNSLGEFDPTKIGSGEGAQAYGYGHYLAENPVISKGYAKTLSEHRLFDANGNPFDPHVVLQNPNVRAVLSKTNGDIDAAIARANQSITRIPGTTGAEYAANDIVKLQEIKKAGGLRKQEGNLYKVDLPDEAIPRMLDWDKHLTEQSPQVQKILSDYQKELGTSFGRGDQTLKEIAFDLRMKGFDDSPAAVSKKLRELGIPGIQFLDAGSRGAGTGTRNFVVFPGNESLLKILKRE